MKTRMHIALMTTTAGHGRPAIPDPGAVRRRPSVAKARRRSRPPALTRQQAEEAYHLAIVGIRAEEIADRFGMSEGSLSKWLNRYGLALSDARAIGESLGFSSPHKPHRQVPDEVAFACVDRLIEGKRLNLADVAREHGILAVSLRAKVRAILEALGYDLDLRRGTDNGLEALETLVHVGRLMRDEGLSHREACRRLDLHYDAVMKRKERLGIGNLATWALRVDESAFEPPAAVAPEVVAPAPRGDATGARQRAHHADRRGSTARERVGTDQRRHRRRVSDTFVPVDTSVPERTSRPFDPVAAAEAAARREEAIIDGYAEHQRALDVLNAHIHRCGVATEQSRDIDCLALPGTEDALIMEVKSNTADNEVTQVLKAFAQARAMRFEHRNRPKCAGRAISLWVVLARAPLCDSTAPFLDYEGLHLLWVENGRLAGPGLAALNALLAK